MRVNGKKPEGGGIMENEKERRRVEPTFNGISGNSGVGKYGGGETTCKEGEREGKVNSQ